MAKEEQNAGFLQLKAAIKAKKLDRLYIFYGVERFLLEHYLGQMKKLVLDEVTEAFNFHRFNNENFTLQNFADAVENLPMMAPFTLVQVDDIDIFKLAEADRDKISQLLEDIPEYCTVIFNYETVPWKLDKRYKKLSDVINKQAVTVEFAIQQQRELLAWITRHFAANGKQISNSLCVYLIELTGGAMTALHSEIIKICAYSGAAEIKKADIDAVTEPVLDAVVFQMTDQMGQGRFPQALETLQKLLKMQQEPIALLGAVGGQFRKISAARTILDNGGQPGELAKLYGMADFAARKTMELAKSFSADFCKTAMELIVETDRRMKTSYDRSERLLEVLILKLAGEARRD